MASIHTSNGAEALTRSTKRLAKRAKRTSRDLKLSAERALDETSKRARTARRTALRSMKKHPLAWTSAALGAAAIAGLALAARRDT